jgi:hypothetical protein
VPFFISGYCSHLRNVGLEGKVRIKDDGMDGMGCDGKRKYEEG